MADSAKPLYEGLFLFSPSEVAGNLSAAIDHLREILTRSNADIVAISRWDERKMAYEIKGQKRGLYVLAYFRVEGPKIAVIERDVALSEMALRCLILRADHFGEVELELAKQKEAETLDAIRLGDQPAAEARDDAQQAPDNADTPNNTAEDDSSDDDE